MEEGWAHGGDFTDFIARDEDDLVFVSCQVTQNSGEGFPEEDTDRGTLGRLTAAYLSEHLDFEDVMVRFDIVSLLVVGDSATISTRSARPSRKPPLGSFGSGG